jgi:hypothetical protein
MNISIDLTAQTPDYAMYTELGNAAVHAIVVAAKDNRLSWAETHDALSALAEQEQFSEATDTAVREVVYHALGVKDEPFYVW